MAASDKVPSMAPYPDVDWRKRLMPEEWAACLEAWISLAEFHLRLDTSDFQRLSAEDGSISTFLQSYVFHLALPDEVYSTELSPQSKELRKRCYLLGKRLLECDTIPPSLQSWNFLADFSRVFGKALASKALNKIWRPLPPKILELSLADLKFRIIQNLEAGIGDNLKELEKTLNRLNHLIYCSPDSAIFFMSGSDFVDGLITAYKIMNPPLRKTILFTLFVCLVGLTEGSHPNLSLLNDQLYALKTAAEVHKTGPINKNDSLVAELVTVTPVLKHIELRLQGNDVSSKRTKSVLASLSGFRGSGPYQAEQLLKRKANRGKAKVNSEHSKHQPGYPKQLHVHRMSLITQVQDLFPDLGSAFILKLLEEYKDDVEQVVSHLLEEQLPGHLKTADRTEMLSPTLQSSEYGAVDEDMTPRSTPPQLPSRRNVFDNDEFDHLKLDSSRLLLGRKNPRQTADKILQDRTRVPNKAAILSALAAFDSDDDERDDTYDAEDVGGTIDSAAPGYNIAETPLNIADDNDEVLFQIFKATPSLFERNTGTRRSTERISLREETKMTDEAIEGWALMLTRDPRKLRRLEAKYSSFRGDQQELASTAWKDSEVSVEDDSTGRAQGSRGGIRNRSSRGRGGRVGNSAGPSGDRDTQQARRKKEIGKGFRKDAAARKMARGGFAA